MPAQRQPVDSAGLGVRLPSGLAEAFLIPLGNRSLLVPLDALVEAIAPPRDITPVPSTVPWLLGITHYRGNLLPVFDLVGFLASLGAAVRPTPEEQEAKVLVLRQPELPFGLMVPKPLGRRRFALESPAETDAEGLPGGLLAGRSHHDGEGHGILDPAALAEGLQEAVSAAETGQIPR